MTNNLKMNVYGLVWEDLTGDEMPADDEIIDSYFNDGSCDETYTLSEHLIDFTTVPAVAAMIENDLICTLAIGGVDVMAARLIALEAFRVKVASMMTAEDCTKAQHAEYDESEPTDDDVLLYREEMDLERLNGEFEALESLIEEARSLAADTAPTPAAAKSDLEVRP